MQDHARPGGNEAEAEPLGADHRADDAHQPHARDVEDKGRLRVADTLHHAFNDNGESIERFGNGDHAKQRKWKEEQSRIRTEKKRPDLMEQKDE